MSPDEYQEAAIRSESDSPGLFERMEIVNREVHACMGIQTEAGELCDVYKKYLFYNKPIDRTNVIEEMGDLLWYMALLADSVGTSLEECMIRNIAKLRARYPEKFTEKKAQERNLDAERTELER